MFKSKLFLTPAIVLAVSACSGTGGGNDGSGLIYGEDTAIVSSDGEGSGILAPAEFDALADAFDALSSALGNDTYTQPATRPTGTVGMTGYIGFADEGTVDEVVIGNMTLSVAFDTNDVSGTAGDFGLFDTSGNSAMLAQAIDGTLTIEGSNVGNDFEATLTGGLLGGTIGIDATMTGSLYDVEGIPTYFGSVGGTFDDGIQGNISGDFVTF